jgi:hypothetical protein
MQNLGQFFRENRKFLVRISFTSLVFFLMGLYGVYVNPSFFAQNRSYFLMPYITWSIPFVWSFFVIYGFLLFRKDIRQRQGRVDE